MEDLEGRSKDLKDKVACEGKESYGKATGDRSKETEGKAQSVGADIKSKARNIGDEIKEGFEDVKEKFSKKDHK